MNQPAKQLTVAESTSQIKVLSSLVQRYQLAQTAGLQHNGARDLYEVFGYDKSLKPEQLLAKYKRQDIASRIVDAPPGATWSRPPTLPDESPLKAQWESLLTTSSLKFLNALYRVDRLARLNTFSLLLFGFDDTGNMQTPAGKVKEILYVRPIAGSQVTDMTYVSDPKDSRYGMPETYTIQFEDPNQAKGIASPTKATGIKDLIVHWTRVVHIVEYPLEDPIHGTPILEKVYNQLDDLLKVGGGTAEMYWLTGNRGLHANIDSEMEIDPADAAALSDEISEYQHNLRRMIRTRGVDLKVLDSTTPNPKETFEMIMSIISGTTGIPRRILLGSEAGQLASEQDRANWAERIEERRILFVDPEILNPTIERLQAVGLMVDGTAEWVWPSAFIQNPLEEGQTMAQIARAVGNLSRQTGASTPMQLLGEKECRTVLRVLLPGIPELIPDDERFELADYQKELATAKTAGGGGKESDAAKASRTEKKQDQGISDRSA